MVVHTCETSIWEMEGGGAGVQGHPHQCSWRSVWTIEDHISKNQQKVKK